MSDFAEEAEKRELFRERKSNNSLAMFNSKGSAGTNPIELARILAVLDLCIEILNWKDKPLANLTNFLTQYQASLDAKYHNDYKQVLIAEEIEHRREERKGISILSQ